MTAQTDVPCELIVVDNGSTDGTRDWLEARSDLLALNTERDPAATRSSNISIARNAGLRHARGAYVWFLDDDDRLRPGAVATLARALDERPAAVAAVGARTRFGDGVVGGRIAHPLARVVGDLGRSCCSAGAGYRARHYVAPPRYASPVAGARTSPRRGPRPVGANRLARAGRARARHRGRVPRASVAVTPRRPRRASQPAARATPGTARRRQRSARPDAARGGPLVGPRQRGVRKWRLSAVAGDDVARRAPGPAPAHLASARAACVAPAGAIRSALLRAHAPLG